MGAFFCLELVLFNEGVVWDFVSRRIAMCSVVELDGLGLLGKRTLCVCVPIRMIGRKAGVGDLGRNLHLKENVKYRAGRFANEVLLNGR